MTHDKDLPRAGVWIDQEEAVVVILEDGCVNVVRIQPDAEKHGRRAGGSRPQPLNGPQRMADNKMLDRRRVHQLELGDFYGEVAKALKRADRIYLFGPGRAKGDLEKEVQRPKGGAARIVAVHPEDKMTEEQVIAKVKAFYGMQSKRFAPGRLDATSRSEERTA